jgi:hypothetical protein
MFKLLYKKRVITIIDIVNGLDLIIITIIYFDERGKFMNTRAKIQSFGGFLTGMILPNIGAFIAWGLITAFFIPTGWMPNSELA